LKVYLDACALNRLTDDPSQSRIRAEAEAVEEILRRIESASVRWIASTVLRFELSRNPDHKRRRETSGLLLFAKELYAPSAECVDRARTLEALGYGALDAVHLACAEEVYCDVFLTTDDRLIRRAQSGTGNLKGEVMNPVEFLERPMR